MEKLDLAKGYSLKGLQNEVGEQIAAFRKEREKIKMSDEPRLQVGGQKDWEIQNLRKTFEDNIKAIEQEYQQLGSELIAEQKEKAAKSQFVPSQPVREKVDAITDDFSFFYMTADSEADKKTAVKELSEKVDQLGYMEKGYFRRKMPEIMKLAGDGNMSVKSLFSSMTQGLRSIQTEEESALGLLKQDVAAGPLAEYRTMMAAEKSSEKARKQWEGSGDNMTSFDYEVEYKKL